MGSTVLGRIFSSGGGGASGIYTYKGTFTAAQTKALFTSPQTLISSPGANRTICIDVESIVVKLGAGSDFSFSGFITLKVGSTSYFIMSGTDINSSNYTAGGNPPYSYDPQFTAENSACILSADADSLNGTRTFTLSFKYYIIDLN